MCSTLKSVCNSWTELDLNKAEFRFKGAIENLSWAPTLSCGGLYVTRSRMTSMMAGASDADIEFHVVVAFAGLLNDPRNFYIAVTTVTYFSV